MKALIAAAVLGVALPVFAQAPKAPAKEEKKEAPKAEEKSAAAPKKANPKRQEDARHCLDQPSNTAVIKCAEAYL